MGIYDRFRHGAEELFRSAGRGVAGAASSLDQHIVGGAHTLADGGRALYQQAAGSALARSAEQTAHTVAGLPGVRHVLAAHGEAGRLIDAGNRGLNSLVTRGEQGLQDRLEHGADAATAWMRHHGGARAGRVTDAVTHAGADFVGGMAGLSGGALRVGGSALGLAAHGVVNPMDTAWGTARGVGHLAGGAADLLEHTQMGAPLHALHAAGSRLLEGGTIRQSLAAGGHAGMSALDPSSPEMRQYYSRLGTRAAGLAQRAGTAMSNARGVDIGDVTGRVVGNLALGAVGGEGGAAASETAAATEAAAATETAATAATAERAVLAEQAGAGHAAATEAAAAERASLPHGELYAPAEAPRSHAPPAPAEAPPAHAPAAPAEAPPAHAPPAPAEGPVGYTAANEPVYARSDPRYTPPDSRWRDTAGTWHESSGGVLETHEQQLARIPPTELPPPAGYTAHNEPVYARNDPRYFPPDSRWRDAAGTWHGSDGSILETHNDQVMRIVRSNLVRSEQGRDALAYLHGQENRGLATQFTMEAGRGIFAVPSRSGGAGRINLSPEYSSDTLQGALVHEVSHLRTGGVEVLPGMTRMEFIRAGMRDEALAESRAVRHAQEVGLPSSGRAASDYRNLHAREIERLRAQNPGLSGSELARRAHEPATELLSQRWAGYVPSGSRQSRTFRNYGEQYGQIYDRARAAERGVPPVRQNAPQPEHGGAE